jgi:hypothetical protein
MYPLHVLFTTGHKLTGIGMYFNQAKLVRILHPFAHEQIHEMELDWINHLKKISKTFAQAVLDLNETITQLGKETQATPPRTPEEYLVWANENHKWLMNQLPKERAARALYLYGFSVGEMMSTLTLCSCALDISAQYAIPLDELLENGRQRGLETLKRWDSLARTFGEVEVFRFLRTHFLALSSPTESILLEHFSNLSKEEKNDKARMIRDKIDQIGTLEEECLQRLKIINEELNLDQHEPSQEDQ